MRPQGVTLSQWLKHNLYYFGEYVLGLKNSEKYLRPKKIKLYNEVLHELVKKQVLLG